MGLLHLENPFVQDVCARENSPTYDNLWDDFVQEEITLEFYSAKQKEVEDLSLIRWMRKVKKEYSSQVRNI
jgi:hypothetical protein